MVSKLADLVTGGQLVQWLILLLIVGYFAYKEWPELKRRISAGPLKEAGRKQDDQSTRGRLTAIEKELREIDDKLARDYERINAIERDERRNSFMVGESLEEREIIMRALLGALQGLQELGANGPTKAAEAEINAYLIAQAHRKQREHDNA